MHTWPGSTRDQRQRDLMVLCDTMHCRRCALTHTQTYAVEADASSATYALAIAAITGGSVTVDGVGRDSLQGDAQFCKVRRRFNGGCRVLSLDLTVRP